MQRFTATLVAEGSSDQALVPFIEFALDAYCTIPHVTTFANDLVKGALSERIAQALLMHPCDLLFVHRDADRATVAVREQEIRNAALAAGRDLAVCVVPVRMTEAWLLVDPLAIRRAASNPAGGSDLALPSITRLESLTDPKRTLFAALEIASGLGPNRLRQFDRYRARRQVSGFMEDVSMLRQLPSFLHFEAQVQRFFRDAVVRNAC